MNRQEKAEEYYFPTGFWRYVGLSDIAYRPYKHWGSGYRAAESMEHMEPTGDRSGCLVIINGQKMTSVPVVVEARHYQNMIKAQGLISAVLSYPGGIGLDNHYFWEIYPSTNGDIERFDSEWLMEQKIRKLFEDETFKGIEP